MSDEKRLGKLYRSLGPAQQEMLLAFAEFLAGREEATGAAKEIPLPAAMPRPEQESVVKAIKRLMATYHMLDRRKLLPETSSFMTQHVMQGRPAREVIDELEIVFARHYEQFKAEQ